MALNNLYSMGKTSYYLSIGLWAIFGDRKSPISSKEIIEVLGKNGLKLLGLLRKQGVVVIANSDINSKKPIRRKPGVEYFYMFSPNFINYMSSEKGKQEVRMGMEVIRKYGGIPCRSALKEEVRVIPIAMNTFTDSRDLLNQKV